MVSDLLGLNSILGILIIMIICLVEMPYWKSSENGNFVIVSCNILYIIDNHFQILILICYEFIGSYFYHKSRAVMITYNCQFDTMLNQI